MGKELERKVHSVIPKPSNTIAEKLGFDEVNLKVSLSDDTKSELELTRGILQEETRKTRRVLWIGLILNAVAFLIGKSI